MGKAMGYGLVAILACALVLAGCSSGGSSSNAELERVLEAETAREAAEAERKAAEEAKAKAEAEAKAIEEAQAKAVAEAKAEAEAKVAEDARLKAEAEEAAKVKAAAEAEAARVKAAAEAAEAARVKAEADARAAEIEAQRKADAAQLAVLAELVEAIDALTTRQAAAQTAETEDEEEEAEEEETPAATTTPPASTTTTPAATTPAATTSTTSTPEANQRATNLKAAFGTPPDSITMPLNTDTVVITAARRGSLALKAGGYSPATLSGNGLRSATMALRRGGDTGKIVVYTDRELTRPLLDHYGQFKASPSAVQFQVNGAAASEDSAGLIPITAIPSGFDTDVGTVAEENNIADRVVDDKDIDAFVSVSHGLRGSLGANDRTLLGKVNNRNNEADPPEPLGSAEDRVLISTKDHFTGSVHGVGGQFRCTGVTNCMITVRGGYVDNSANTDKNKLEAVDMLIPADAELHFKPNSLAATVSLCDDGVQCTAGTDERYMVFGWWKEVPTKASGQYEFGTFAEVKGGAVTDISGVTARYDGAAVGMYVEQDPNDPVDTHRQGEFTADADLRVANGNVFGTVDDFVTTPTDGSAAPRTSDRWLVKLGNDDAATTSPALEDIAIENMAGMSTGSWNYQLVQPHADAEADSKPPAIVGAFNVRIVDSVHIVGAFGAEIR